MSPSEATSLIVARATEAPAQFKECGRAAAMYWACNELWNDEYASWQATATILGSDSGAAKCAWERRTAYAEISSVLLQAW
jgi:hypothetical protein